MSDSEQELRAAGFAVDKLPEEQREVLQSLSPEEAKILVSVKSRLDDAAGDVQGYARNEDFGGTIF